MPPVPLPFRIAHNSAATMPGVASDKTPTRFAAGMLDGRDLGFIPNNTIIPLGGGFVTSPPILVTGFNDFLFNFFSTTGTIQIFIAPCEPGNSAMLFFGGTFAFLNAAGFMFDEALFAPGPYIWGSDNTNSLGSAVVNAMVWHTFVIILANPDLLFDAQIQWCELYGNARLLR